MWREREGGRGRGRVGGERGREAGRGLGEREREILELGMNGRMEVTLWTWLDE